MSDGSNVVVGAIMQHIEQAGIHSGDSACSLPPYNLSEDTQDQIRDHVTKLALELNVIGLMNTQLAYQDGKFTLSKLTPSFKDSSFCLKVHRAFIGKDRCSLHDWSIS